MPNLRIGRYSGAVEYNNGGMNVSAATGIAANNVIGITCRTANITLEWLGNGWCRVQSGISTLAPNGTEVSFDVLYIAS